MPIRRWKNYNVVLPLADLCLGTLLMRSKVAFAQAQGPAVPNVQPRLGPEACGENQAEHA